MAIPKNGDWSRILGAGENPNGFVSQTPNGTMMNGKGADGDQWPMALPADGPRWSRSMPEVRSFGIGATLPRTARGKK